MFIDDDSLRELARDVLPGGASFERYTSVWPTIEKDLMDGMRQEMATMGDPMSPRSDLAQAIRYAIRVKWRADFASVWPQLDALRDPP